MSKKNQKEEVTYVNDFGVPLFIDKKNKAALRERVALLKKVVETGHPIGSKKALSQKNIDRAEMHIRWYTAELKKLNGAKKSSKKSA